jgi:hypothetical protein
MRQWFLPTKMIGNLASLTIKSNFLPIVDRPLGTGHKVFTRGCGGYCWGVRKNPRTSERGPKKATEPPGGSRFKFGKNCFAMIIIKSTQSTYVSV